MNIKFDIFKKSKNTFVKEWMEKMHKLNPYSQISLKIEKDILVIVCDESTEKNKVFREYALDFLVSFENKYKNCDIIIVPENDKFYNFSTYDYRLTPLISTYVRSDVIMDNTLMDKNTDYQWFTDESPQQKLADTINVKKQEWVATQDMILCQLS